MKRNVNVRKILGDWTFLILEVMIFEAMIIGLRRIDMNF
jgi:hypothetical protein